jgi:hypothetical protein
MVISGGVVVIVVRGGSGRVMGVITMCDFGRGLFVSGGRGGVIVVPMVFMRRCRRVFVMTMRGHGMVIVAVTRVMPGVRGVTVIVVRLVLVAHDSNPPAAARGLQRRNRYNVIKRRARLRSPRKPEHTDARR